MAADELPILTFATQAEWEAWLEIHHAESPGVRLRFAKEGAPDQIVTYVQAVESALCFGWIDGQANRIDQHFWMVRFTPRRARSIWSRKNRERVEFLQQQGRMRPAGEREVARAMADGRWEAALNAVRETEEPADLVAALEANPAAREVYARVTNSVRHTIFDHIAAAKRPETRQKRIAQYVARLAAGEVKFY